MLDKCWVILVKLRGQARLRYENFKWSHPNITFKSIIKSISIAQVNLNHHENQLASMSCCVVHNFRCYLCLLYGSPFHHDTTMNKVVSTSRAKLTNKMSGFFFSIIVVVLHINLANIKLWKYCQLIGKHYNFFSSFLFLSWVKITPQWSVG